jgi:uncharacterized membrane protein HdeD (DUF308 family)
MSDVTDFVAAVVGKVRKSWGWFLVTGILIIILGVFCVGKAQIAIALSILTLGWILVISAGLWLACALYTFGLCGLPQYLPNPIIRGVIGFLLIRHPDVGAEGVAVLLAVLFIVLGLFRALTASVYKLPRWEWSVFSGLVSFCLGVYLLNTWHTASSYLFGLLIGLDLIVDGTALVGFASAIHGLPEVQRKAA